MKGREILLARHGSSGLQYLNRYLGSTDAPLAEEGFADCRQLSERIREAGFRPEQCWCSPLLRTRQTAAVVTGALDIPVLYDDALREIDFGRWEGMSFAEISASDQGLVADWTARPENFRFPGGERVADFRSRVRVVADRLAETEDCVLVIAHGGVIRAMICHFLGISMENHLLFEVKAARLAVVSLFGERGVLSGLNL